MKEQIEKSLVKVRQMLSAEGGDIELVEVTPDNVVKVKLKGACGCCPMSQMTMKMGVERIIKQDVPQVKEVIAV
jgi:Fe-S cluster biogenesis protein NfuA